MNARQAAAAALIAAAALAGCGSGGSTSAHAHAAQASGASVFDSAGCASCHTLAAAHARGQVGPNLDRLKPSFADVEHQVRVGGGAMPAFGKTLSPRAIRAVARYVERSSR